METVRNFSVRSGPAPGVIREIKFIKDESNFKLSEHKSRKQLHRINYLIKWWVGAKHAEEISKFSVEKENLV